MLLQPGCYDDFYVEDQIDFTEISTYLQHWSQPGEPADRILYMCVAYRPDEEQP